MKLSVGMKHRTALLVAIAALLGGLVRSVQAAPYAYIGGTYFCIYPPCNPSGPNLSIIDTANDTIVCSTVNYEGMFGAAAKSGNANAYLSAVFGGVAFLFPESPPSCTDAGAILANISGDYWGVACNAQTHRCYFASNDDTDYSPPGAVTVVDTLSNTVLATFPVPYAWAVAVNHAGSYIYVTTAPPDPPGGEAYLYIFDTSTNTAAHIFDLGAGSSYGVAVHPADRRVYATFVPTTGNGSLKVINPNANTPTVTSLSTGTGSQPFGVAVDRLGSKAFLTDQARNFMRVVTLNDAGGGTMGSTYAAGAQPKGLAITPDGTKMYVCDSGSNAVSVLSTTSPYPVLTTISNVAASPMCLGDFISPFQAQ